MEGKEDFYRFKKGVAQRIENKNNSFEQLNVAISKFFTHLTTILVIFLGLIAQMKPQENLENLPYHLYRVLICLLVLCLLFCVLVLYGEISLERKNNQIRQRILLEYIDSDGAKKNQTGKAKKLRVFYISEILALVFFALSLICFLAYSYCSMN